MSGRGHARSRPAGSTWQSAPAAGSQRWGFHRLGEPWARRLVADSGVAAGDLVVDLGAGDGGLTAALLAAGARVIAVELHPARQSELRRRFAGAPVSVVCADIANLRWPRRPFSVVANPPYAVTAALLRQLLAPGRELVSADLVLQRRMVRHLLEHPPDGARRWGRDCELRRGMTVPRAAFRPPPRVDSAVLQIRRRAR